MSLQERIRTAAAQPQPRRSRKKWVEPTPDDFAAGVVLSFDQTLTKTGWALVVSGGEWPLAINEGGLFIQPKIEGLKGFEEDYQRALLMGTKISAAVSLMSYGTTAIVHEMPAIHGYRSDSSRMAGLLVRQAAQTFARGVPVAMVNKQQVASILIPPDQDRSDKANMKAAVNRLIPNYCRRTSSWNQDVSDAAANALAYLWRKQHDASH